MMIGAYGLMGFLLVGLVIQGYWIKQLWLTQRGFRAKLKVEEAHLLVCAESILQTKEELQKARKRAETVVLPVRSAR